MVQVHGLRPTRRRAARQGPRRAPPASSPTHRAERRPRPPQTSGSAHSAGSHILRRWPPACVAPMDLRGEIAARQLMRVTRRIPECSLRRGCETAKAASRAGRAIRGTGRFVESSASAPLYGRPPVKPQRARVEHVSEDVLLGTAVDDLKGKEASRFGFCGRSSKTFRSASGTSSSAAIRGSGPGVVLNGPTAMSTRGA
jgi:hypothetical protein